MTPSENTSFFAICTHSGTSGVLYYVKYLASSAMQVNRVLYTHLVKQGQVEMVRMKDDGTPKWRLPVASSSAG